MLVTHNQAPQVAQLGKQALNFPSALVATQSASVLRPDLLMIAVVGRDHLDVLGSQRLVQWVAFIGAIANQLLRLLLDKAVVQRFFDEGYFAWASICDADDNWKTSAVCHCHDLRTFAPLDLSYPSAPFLRPQRCSQ